MSPSSSSFLSPEVIAITGVTLPALTNSIDLPVISCAVSPSPSIIESVPSPSASSTLIFALAVAAVTPLAAAVLTVISYVPVLDTVRKFSAESAAPSASVSTYVASPAFSGISNIPVTFHPSFSYFSVMSVVLITGVQIA